MKKINVFLDNSTFLLLSARFGAKNPGVINSFNSFNATGRLFSGNAKSTKLNGKEKLP